MRAKFTLLCVLLVGALAWAAGSSSKDVELKVGETKTVPVGYAKGLICDDLKIASAEIKDATAENNVVVIRGLKVGKTQCRAGTDKDGPRVFLSVTVSE